MFLFEWLLLLGGVGLLTLTETYQPSVLTSLALLVVSTLLRVLRTRRLAPCTGLEIPLALFLTSAAASVWAAYDQPLAWLQVIRFLAAATLFYALATSERKFNALVAWGFLIAAAALALYWPLQHDFGVDPGKFPFITTLGLWINHTFPAPPGPSVHANIGAGALLLAAPTGAVLGWEGWRARRLLLALLAAMLTLLVLAGLLLTSSRGAWLGLAAAGGLSALAWAQRRWLPSQKAQALFWGVFTALGLIALAGLAATGLLDRLLGQIPDPSGSLMGRSMLWKQALPLARDYFFTGLGLMNFPMIFSTYGILIHVFYISHVHNTYLEVLLEQGIVGAAAFAWLILVVVGWGWRALRRKDTPPLAWAGLAALAAAAVHGFFDVPLYLNRTLPLIGLVAGLAFLAVRSDRNPPEHPQKATVRSYLPLAAAAAVAVAGLLLLGLGVWLYPPLGAAWQANLGAIQQAQVEIPAYDSKHFDNPSLDQLRQRLDLSRAEAHFRRALELDPANPTANQRLTHLALARGSYEQALGQMQAVWEAGHRDEVTRLLYGDALAANARPEEAVQVVRGLTWAEGRLMFQAFYRYWRGQDYARCADAWRAVLALNPQNTRAGPAIQQALQKLPQTDEK